MSIYKRGDTYGADLREFGAGRQSMFTKNYDVARLLHNELEQRALRGEKITSQLAKALLATITAPRAAVVAQVLGTQVQPIAVAARKVAGITLDKAFQLAKVEREDWRASKSFKTIEANFNFVAEHFGRQRALDEITSADITGYKAKLIEEEKSPSTTNQRLSILSVLFDTAEELEYPVVKPRIKFVKVRRGRTRILSRDEEHTTTQWFQNSKASALDTHMADLVPCLLDTGFRLSEMLRVDKGCVQWESNRVLAWVTKADLPRAVPMTKRVRAILERRFKAHGEQPWDMLTVFNCAHRWDVMRKANGITDKQFVIHALRHTTATRLAAAGVDAFKIQQWMGHKQISTTQIYVNLAASHLDVLKDALEVPAECAKPVEFFAELQNVKAAKSFVDQVTNNAVTD